MTSLARYHMYFGRYFSPTDLIALLEKVTPERAENRATILQPERIAGECCRKHRRLRIDPRAAYILGP